MTMKSKNVVVAGATGYLGRHVVRALHRGEHRVRALSRRSSGLTDIRHLCDEVFIGEATDPGSIKGLCDGADVVFSSLGTRSLKRSPTIWDVDYQANKNVLDEARSAGVEHFVFVAGINGAETRNFSPQIEARERIVDDLVSWGPAWTIVRPTGFFNDMAELFRMAEKGSVWLTGDGTTRINPIHGEDLANECRRAIEDSSLRGKSLSVGGPDIFSFDEAAALALETVGKRGKIRHTPAWTVRVAGRAVGSLNTNLGSLLQLISLMGEQDFVGEQVGEHHLVDFYRNLAKGDDLETYLWAR